MYLIEWHKDKRYMGQEQIGFDTRAAAEEYLRRQYPGDTGPGTPTIFQVTAYTIEEVRELFPQT